MSIENLDEWVKKHIEEPANGTMWRVWMAMEDKERDSIIQMLQAFRFDAFMAGYRKGTYRTVDTAETIYKETA